MWELLRFQLEAVQQVPDVPDVLNTVLPTEAGKRAGTREVGGEGCPFSSQKAWMFQIIYE